MKQVFQDWRRGRAWAVPTPLGEAHIHKTAEVWAFREEEEQTISPFPSLIIIREYRSGRLPKASHETVTVVYPTSVAALIRSAITLLDAVDLAPPWGEPPIEEG